jgi:uncharacterized protein
MVRPEGLWYNAVPVRDLYGTRLMKFNPRHPNKPLIAALVFQGAMIPGALLLALLFGLSPWHVIWLDSEALWTTLLATALPLALAWWLSRQSFVWVGRLLDKVHQVLDLLFRGNRTQWAIIAVSLLAGFGEELLFRGVIQAGLEQLTGAAAGLLLASLIFGLLHAITPAYFLLATIMGLYLGLLYQQTGNLLIPCLVHALYDWAAITWYLRGRTTVST